jgi:3-methyladenine DNA glycosylase AlkC
VAAPLTDHFGTDIPGRIAETLPVDARAFVEECLIGYEDLGLMDRARRIADVMRNHLDPDPAAAVDQVAASLGSQRPEGMAGFFYNPHAMFIGTYGLPAYEQSMSAMHSLTKLFTAEWPIRPFIQRYPQTMGQLRQWASDPDEHVRLLVSEGTRPRLPWAARLPAFVADPTPVVELLEELKDDTSEYVRRSVGNNLNDISRDNPQVALHVAAKWAPGREALVRRGLRTLVKAGDPGALEILGYRAGRASAEAGLPASLHIGERLPLAITVHCDGPAMVDVVVHFVKADGSTRRKVFKGGELSGSGVVRCTISFAQHSTRTHYPGPHRVEALVNGRVHPLGAIDLRA